MAMAERLKRNRYRGLAAVEFALVLSLLLLLTLGAIRYGHLFLKAQLLTNAARAGAREAVRPSADNSTVDAVIADYMTAAGMDASGYTWTPTPGDVSTGATTTGQPITIQITVPAANVDVLYVPLFTDLEPAGWNLGAAVTMAKEGP